MAGAAASPAAIRAAPRKALGDKCIDTPCSGCSVHGDKSVACLASFPLCDLVSFYQRLRPIRTSPRLSGHDSLRVTVRHSGCLLIDGAAASQRRFDTDRERLDTKKLRLCGAFLLVLLLL